MSGLLLTLLNPISTFTLQLLTVLLRAETLAVLLFFFFFFFLESDVFLKNNS